MNIQQFIHEIVMTIPISQPTQIVYQDVNLYFGTLDYFRSQRVEEGDNYFLGRTQIVCQSSFQ